MADLTGANDGVYANRSAGCEGDARSVKRRGDLADFAQRDGAGLLGFFTNGEGGSERGSVAMALHLHLPFLRGFDGAGGEQVDSDKAGFEKCLGGFFLHVVVIHGGDGGVGGGKTM